jgi:hypothetical protein
VFVLSIIGVCGVAGAPAGIAGADEPLHIRKGLFLVAAPDLTDPNFSETVILITHHGPQGTTGVVINRPTTTLLSRALPDLPALADRPRRYLWAVPWGGGDGDADAHPQPHESAARVRRRPRGRSAGACPPPQTDRSQGGVPLYAWATRV